MTTRPVFFGLPVNTAFLRFNGIQAVLMPTQGQTPKPRLKRRFSALLHVLAKPYRNLTLAGVFSAALGAVHNYLS